MTEYVSDAHGVQMPGNEGPHPFGHHSSMNDFQKIWSGEKAIVTPLDSNPVLKTELQLYGAGKKSASKKNIKKNPKKKNLKKTKKNKKNKKNMKKSRK